MEWPYGIFIPAYKELYWIKDGTIFRVSRSKILALFYAVNKGAQVKFSAGIDEMNPCWPSKRTSPFLPSKIIGSHEPGKNRNQVHPDEIPQGKRAPDTALHDCILILGSSRYRRISASRPPAIKKTEKNITAPITRNKSRPRTASSTNGPMPGQLTITSTSSETLRSPPTEIPNKEIKGLAAAGRACR